MGARLLHRLPQRPSQVPGSLLESGELGLCCQELRRLILAASPEQGVGVPSPCIDICRIRRDGLCEGCLRSRDEIAAWPGLDGPSRRALLTELNRRRSSLQRSRA
ncbi:MAG: DUF1289 domain-containing protein [Gammaproteobacteria bacterium]